MKIELQEIAKITIEEFAAQHGLVMEVNERARPIGAPTRYFARFKDSGARDGMCGIIGLFGNGSTPAEAIAEYARVISLRLLIIHSWTQDRREIPVPRLSPSAPPDGEAGLKLLCRVTATHPMTGEITLQSPAGLGNIKLDDLVVMQRHTPTAHCALSTAH